VHYHGGLDLPREKVPQLSGTIGGTYHGPAEVIPKFTGWLGRHGVSVTSERADPHSLRPVKATGSYRTVRGLADEIKSGKREPDWKPLLVSSDGYVVDGTQTWAAKMLSDHEGGPKPGVSVVRADVPLERLMPLAAQFMSEIGMPYRKAGEVADPRYQDTMRLHQRPDGTWDPERQKLHEAIIAGALAGVTPVDHPTATFLGGGTASGKSSVFPAGSEANTVHIDSDKIKEQLPEYPPMVAAGDRNAANHVHEESSYLARRIQAEAERRHLNFTLDSTGDGEYGKMRRKIDQARAAGHRVVGRYVTIDTEAAVQRARKRAEETGREVPASVLRENHRAVAGVFRRLVDDRALDRAELWDNTASPPAPRLVGEQTGTGLLVRDQESWRKFLAKGGEK
jgi:predicted ABC-type ATPase